MKGTSNRTLHHSQHNKDWNYQYKDEIMERNDSAVIGWAFAPDKKLALRP